jgi:tight adherence protein B
MHLRDELSAGSALRPAMLAALDAGRDPGMLPTVRAACLLGGDVPAALRIDGAHHPAARSLAALWQVSEGSGAGLAEGLDRLLESARRAAAVRREVDAQLAGPRGTVRVLAVLPLVGVGLGLAMGADPVGFLLGTRWGWACLVAAAGLEGLGVLWMRALVKSVEDQL